MASGTDVATGIPPEYAEPERRTFKQWLGEDLVFSAFTIKKQSLLLVLMRLPAFIPLLFIARGWFSLNQQSILTNTEADVLGSGGELCFFLAITVTPMITLTGQRWFAPLRRWYGIMFAVIGIGDATTAAITTEFKGGVFGRLAGHSFLVSGFLIILMGIPLLVTANTPAQRKMGRYWKKLQKMTYVIWGMIVLHLFLLDGLTPFGGSDGDGISVFHQRFYQVVALSLPLFLLRLPPVKRWVAEQQAAGEKWKVWLAFMPLLMLYVIAFVFICNEEIFTGTMVVTMHPPAN